MTLQPVRFLLVEDDEDHTDLLRLALLDNHVINVVDRVADGVDALRYLRRQGEYAQAPRPDVILLDLKLPKIDGLAFLRQLKADPDLCVIRVAVLSSSSRHADRTQAFADGAEEYITKPLNFEKIHQLVMAMNLRWSIGLPAE